ncbi:MAG TPA: F0F1 ATP synthase subunit delta [Candidatus Azoamicus sp. OHIO2]
MSVSTTIARPYARAIFDIAKNNNSFDEWDNLLSYLSCILENKNINDFIKNKTICHDDKALLINNLLNLKQSFNVTTQVLCNSFVKALAYYNRLLYLNEIKNLYVKHVNTYLGKLEALIEIASNISNETKNEIIICLANKFEKKISALFNINEVLLGGFVVKIDDFVLDASIAGNLISLRNKIMV